MHWQGICGLKPSAVIIDEDTRNHKPTLYDSMRYLRQWQRSFSMIKQRQHKLGDVTTAESLWQVIGRLQMGGNNILFLKLVVVG